MPREFVINLGGTKYMHNIVVSTILRGIGIYILALLLARIMGRKLISQMTSFDFVVGVSMGSLVASAIIGPEGSPLTSTIALVVVSIMSAITAFIHIKSIRVRKIVNSEPVTLVQKGIIVEENMKKVRLTIDELMMKLREKNAFNLADVEFAIMETDGQLSVLPKSNKQPLTPSHMNIQGQNTGLTKDVIIDGNIIEGNLLESGFNRKWLTSQLKSQNIKDASEVFYAGLDSSKRLYISKKGINKNESHDKYGIE